MSDLELRGRAYGLTGNVYTTGTRQVLTNVHPREMCEGHPCCIHAPSAHPLVNAPTHWSMGHGWIDDDDGVDFWQRGEIMQRICPHGVFHPDPDDLTFIRETKGEEAAERLAEHECCGCCS